MASNPSFQVEDQTDEEFFNKLVDDEFEGTAPGPKFAEGSDSDETKAFANLSIGDAGAAFDDSGVKGGFEPKATAINCPVDGDSLGAHVEESNSLVQSSSFGVNSGNESNDCVTKSEYVSNPPMSNTGGSRGSGVKEVQWSAFNTDSAPNGSSNCPDLFNDLGESSGDFPGEMVGNLSSEAKTVSVNGEYKTEDLGYSVNYGQYAVSQDNGMTGEQSVIGQDLSSSQYGESLNPGWKYDPNSGQLYQVDDNAAVGSVVSDEKPEVSYLQQTAQSVAGTVTESGTTASVSSWNQSSQANNGYPEHMIFDPQHPDWYYDTNAQEWRSLASYIAWGQTSVQTYDQHYQNEFPSTGTSSYKSDSGVYNNYGLADNYGSKGQDSSWSGSFINYNHSIENGFAFTDPSHSNDSEVHGQYGQSDSHGSQVFDGQVQDNKWGGSSNLNQQGPNMWQAETDAKSKLASYYRGNQQLENMYASANSINNPVFKQMSYNSTGTVPMYEKASQGHNSTNEVGLRTSVPIGNFNQQLNGAIEQNEQMHSLNDHKSSQKSLSFSEQSFRGGHQFSHAPSMGRSSAGRPPHALVAFGFGGKLIIMKDCNTLGNSSFGNQEPAGCSITFLSLMEVITEKTDALSIEVGASDYFHSLCQKSVPGPLVGGNVGSKELNKWIDERIANCESSYMNSRKGEVWRLLLSLLKIACQYYGKLRSPFGADTLLRENDIPETAVAKLFASAKNGAQGSQYGALTNCLQSLPSEGQLRAIASDVQNLVVSGRKKEALHSAQEGQLWGPALVLASQLGDQFYVETVKKMALHQLVPGSPLRTLCLLIAGQPADVFSTDTTAESGFLAGVNMSAPSAQFGAISMLDDWEENLAVITANRTTDDELVLIHLGDCLWRERSEITAAHICYLVAEANFESYSDSARLCLIGADHWKFPRTYASPEAIQRTELYEYSKVLGNSQFILLPFQPYKLLYAHMLAEVGKVSDAQKYCQAVLKSLKTGQTPEGEMWKQLASSLEERIRNHQQGGYASNFVSGQFGKFLSFIDNTAHRVVGGLPPPVPSATQGSAQGNEHYYQQVGPRVSTSQSTLAMSSLMPSASMEPVSEWKADGGRRTMHNRSVSEPDIGRTPRQDQVDLSKEAASSDAKGKTSVSGGLSRFSPFGFGSQILQKSLGLMLKSRQDRQAKLGESNKFYYDEKLKRWVEEGAEPPAEEAALPPPPTTASFPNEISDFGLSNASRSEGLSTNGSPDSKSPPTSEGISGMPPVPPSSNQFSARGRMGVRSRYVDTFNQGGGIPANLFQSPSVPSAKPVVAANAKFFIPTPASSGEQAVDTFTERVQEAATSNEVPSTSSTNDLFQSPGPSSSTRMQKFPSMNNIPNNKVMTNVDRSNPSLSRRTASWCGSSNDAFRPPKVAEVKPLGEALGMSPSSFMPSDPVMRHSSLNGGSFAEDLHEVEL